MVDHPLEEWLIATLNFGYTIMVTIDQVIPSFKFLHVNFGIPALFHVKSTLSIKVQKNILGNVELLPVNPWLKK